MFVKVCLSAVLVPVCLALVFAAMKRPKRIKLSEKNFVVYIPNTVRAIGTVLSVSYAAGMLAFTLFSKELPGVIFYVVFGCFFLLGIYLTVKAFTFKMVVTDEEITVFTAFKKPRSFTFGDVVLVKRQVKQGYYKQMERVVIRTESVRRVVVENSFIGYEKLLEKLMQKVDERCLIGF